MQVEKSVLLKIFSGRLKEGLRGHKKSGVAEEIGVAQSSISMYSKGENLPSLEVFRALCVSLGLNADWLLGLSDSRTVGAAQTVTASSGSGHASAVGTGTLTVNASADISRLEELLDTQRRLIDTQQRLIDALTMGKK